MLAHDVHTACDRSLHPHDIYLLDVFTRSVLDYVICAIDCTINMVDEHY